MAQALYATEPNTHELEAFGFTAEDFAQPPVAIWPDNQAAVELFISISTQWRTGPNGMTGLDYNVLFHCLDRRQLPNERYEQLFDDIRVMEIEVLNTIHAPQP